MAPGLYRAMTGNRALAWGILAAAQRSKVPVVYGAYPITPASDILHELAMHKRFRVRTIQAEDEIAAVTAAIGASFGGALGVTASSGPGIALKSEGIGLAVTAELPLVVLNIQRAGPSTGMPTKTEQADLMQALYGRNSEAPVIVLAPATPGDCFYIAYEAVRLAAKYMVPVIVLSDGFLANGSEPWVIPDAAKRQSTKRSLPETPPPRSTCAISIHFPQISATSCGNTAKCWSPRSTADSSCGYSAPNTWWTRLGSTGCAACRWRPRKSTKPSTSFSGASHDPERGRSQGSAEVHEEGLRIGSGCAVVPRLRRLRHSLGDPEDDARPRHSERGHRVHLGDRLLEPLPVLHEHVRLPHDPRPGAGDRHRAPGGAARAEDLRGHRRRRRALDRRQPHAARPAPQREPDDPPVQQPDLRADEGAILAHERARQGDEVDAGWLGGPSDQSARVRPRLRRDLRGAHRRPQHSAHGRDAEAGRQAQGHRVRRDPPELQRVQRSRVERDL